MATRRTTTAKPTTRKPRAPRKPAATRKPTAARTKKEEAAPASEPRRLGPLAVALGAAAVAAGGLLVLLSRAASAIPGLGRRASHDGSFGDGEHPPVDLLGAEHPGPEDRAAEAFRPDPTAPVPAGERDALRPATGPAPSLVAS
jgi:hypothetical protein